MDKLYEMKELIEKLNQYCDEYYNNNNSMISDKEYDKFYDALVNLEKTTGVVFPNSPTHRVGYEVKSSLEKVKHPKKLLSLDKIQIISGFIRNYRADNLCEATRKYQDKQKINRAKGNKNRIQSNGIIALRFKVHKSSQRKHKRISEQPVF